VPRSKKSFDYLFQAEKLLHNLAEIINWVRSGGIERTREELNRIFQTFRKGETGDNPFIILGVDEDASKDEVDAVYLAKVKFAHPDAGGSHERMVRLNQARDEIYKRRGWIPNRT